MNETKPDIRPTICGFHEFPSESPESALHFYPIDPQSICASRKESLKLARRNPRENRKRQMATSDIFEFVEGIVHRLEIRQSDAVPQPVILDSGQDALKKVHDLTCRIDGLCTRAVQRGSYFISRHV
jgi:hypothetical protein